MHFDLQRISDRPINMRADPEHEARPATLRQWAILSNGSSEKENNTWRLFFQNFTLVVVQQDSLKLSDNSCVKMVNKMEIVF